MRLLIIGKDAGGKADGAEPLKELDRPLVRRCPVGNQGIVHIEDDSPVSSLIKFLVRDLVCAVHIVPRIEYFKHNITLNSALQPYLLLFLSG